MFYCLIQIQLVTVFVVKSLKQGAQWICTLPSRFTLALSIKTWGLIMYLNTGVLLYHVFLIQLLHSNMNNLKDVRLSQWCCWRLTSPAMWCCVVGWVLLDISKYCIALIFRITSPRREDCLSLKTKLRQSFQMLRLAHPLTQHHAPEDLNTCNTTSCALFVKHK
jgi:hypothetical protein